MHALQVCNKSAPERDTEAMEFKGAGTNMGVVVAFMVGEKINAFRTTTQPTRPSFSFQ
jgi:hypothetical protein